MNMFSFFLIALIPIESPNLMRNKSAAEAWVCLVSKLAAEGVL